MGFPLELRMFLLIGSFIYLFIIVFLLKKGRLSVQYSIIWLASAFALLLLAIFPYILAVIRGFTGIEVVSNLVFTLLFGFVLLLLLSLSTIVTGFSLKIKRLTQTQALLEKRIRELENRTNISAGSISAAPDKKQE